MCTVTRPGIASIASSTAVELLVSLIQHPAGYVRLHPRTRLSHIQFLSFSVNAPAPPADAYTASQAGEPSASGSVLGLVPHQLRGFLAQFRNMPIVGAAYDKCTGCSETVRQPCLPPIVRWCLVLTLLLLLGVIGAASVREGRL